jgi:hypothetical protein
MTGCASDQKVTITITGDSLGDNEYAHDIITAPEATADPQDGDDWDPFGKGVYWSRALDLELSKPCEAGPDGICVDYQESVGSCYYGGSDFHMGHAIFCDTSEVDCCGYMGCGDDDNRGNYIDGGRHSYYFYVTGNVGGSGCCHCLADCDLSLETAEDAENTCTYYDVTSEDCQRNEDTESMVMDTVGYLKCPRKGHVVPPMGETDPHVVIREVDNYGAVDGVLEADDSSDDGSGDSKDDGSDDLDLEMAEDDAGSTLSPMGLLFAACAGLSLGGSRTVLLVSLAVLAIAQAADGHYLWLTNLGGL